MTLPSATFSDFAKAPPLPLAEGEIVDGKYRVERVLGMGGMGIVVAARHLQLDQRVAIKLVLPAALGNPELVERFAREARAAVRLRSEHVARVLDVGARRETTPPAPYMVMEYLEGHDLGDVIAQRGPLPPHEAVDYLLQACEAIAEAHALGIVHRDLKPKNLFVTTRVDGRPLVKVLDFGISKALPQPGGAPELALTRTTTVMGSPNYMSPEQLRSAKQVDTRTDLWALGIILYESLTGRVPFEAETITQLCALVLEQPPRPIEDLRGDLPPGLSAVILACLEKDPARRMPSVAELARALERFGTATGVAQRIATVAAQAAAGARGAGGDASASGKRVAVSGSTSVAWGETQLADPPRRRGALLAAAAIAIALALAIAAVVARPGAHAPAAPTATVEPTPPTRQIELSPSPSAVAAPPAPSPTAPSAAPTTTAASPLASSPAPPATATSRASLGVPIPALPTKTAPRAAPAPHAAPARPSDDMPAERN